MAACTRYRKADKKRQAKRKALREAEKKGQAKKARTIEGPSPKPNSRDR